MTLTACLSLADRVRRITVALIDLVSPMPVAEAIGWATLAIVLLRAGWMRLRGSGARAAVHEAEVIDFSQAALARQPEPANDMGRAPVSSAPQAAAA